MKNIILPILLFIITQHLYSQELMLSKDSLFIPNQSSADKLTMYNIGTSSLLVNKINSCSYVGYHVNIKLKDTTINTYVLPPYGRELSFSIQPGDSAILFFSEPYCPICKRSEYIHDSIVVHSNSISNPNAYIYVERGYITFVEDRYTQLNGYLLYQNYPNPFNPVTSISFYLPSDEYTTLTIFNNLGQQISELYSDRFAAGNHRIFWNASEFASGTYFYKLETQSFTAIRKMILLK